MGLRVILKQNSLRPWKNKTAPELGIPSVIHSGSAVSPLVPPFKSGSKIAKKILVSGSKSSKAELALKKVQYEERC
jgi:hypothetical protein